jgi:hypothetical protein
MLRQEKGVDRHDDRILAAMHGSQPSTTLADFIHAAAACRSRFGSTDIAEGLIA